jgi:putative redox protein
MGAPSHVHELVSFEGDAGQLSGTLHVPHSSATVGVVLAHCFTCSRSLKITRSLATGIEDGGYAVLRFDFTGLGDSDGEFDSTSVTTNVSDIVAAARYLRKRGYEQIVLAGHSLGGAATLLAADAVPDAQAIVAVAAPFSVEHVRHLFAEQDIDRARSEGRITVSIAGREFQISRAFFDDLEAHCSPERIAALARPLLVVHGSADRVVGIEEGERIFAAARQPRWFASVPEANHLFTHERHARAAARAIVTFLGTVLPSSSP